MTWEHLEELIELASSCNQQWSVEKQKFVKIMMQRIITWRLALFRENCFQKGNEITGTADEVIRH